MTEFVDCIVIGAGVVGLAAARALAAEGREVVVLEAAQGIGTGASSRNSEVIHAGVYYPPGSLKARLCVTGRDMLYGYCQTHGIAYRRYGKIIAATSKDQLSTLEELERRAKANGVVDVEILNRRQIRRLEPELKAVAGLLSPSTGIVDSHALMLSLQGDAETAGAVIAFSSPVEAGVVRDDGRFTLAVGGAEPTRITCATLVNCAGLDAQAIALSLDGLSSRTVPRRYLAKGTYFTLSGRAPFGHLIYPVPEKGGLGIHLTLDLAGQARFGPDVQWIDDPKPAPYDFDVDESRAKAFYQAIRTYWPSLPKDALRPDYTGIRAKLHAPNEPAADFMIQGPSEHGIPNLISLYGIESPGLTASMAIAAEIIRHLG